jgi:hypothetical protein
MKSKTQNEQSGFILIAVLVLLALSMIVAIGLTSAKSSEAMVQAAVNQQSEDYYKVEETMHKTLAWLQDHSQDLLPAFLGANFSTNFDVGDPAVGDNEGANFNVPSLIKMKGTNDSVLLSNNAFFGTSAFPTTSPAGGGTFDAATEFTSAVLGEANARVILMWARETSGDYEPIFRIDVITGNNPDRGVHSFTHAYTSLNASSGATFFTTSETTLGTGNNQCFSYKFSNSGAGSWNKGAARSNCVFYTNSNFSTKAQVNGSVAAHGDLTLVGPGGEVSGSTCSNSAACHSETMPVVLPWATVCGAVNQGNENISGHETWSSGPTPATKCWEDVTVGSNESLTLDDTTNPYFFKTLKLQNNSNSKLKFADIPPGETITVYIDRFDGDKFNGNQFYNPNNAPHQVKIYIMGNNALTMNGTAAIYADIVAPAVDVTLSGNFNFYGGIKSKTITMSGNARINGDEEISGATAATDMTFSIRKASQRFRMY